MDGRRFDDISRGLAKDTSRRTMIGRLLAGALAGAVTIGRRPAAAAAELTDDGSKCSETCDKCSCCRNGKCVPKCPGKTCDPKTGTCGPPCPPAQICGSTCLPAPCNSSACQECDPTTGTCVSSCDPGQTCQGGQCGGGGGGGGDDLPVGSSCRSTDQCRRGLRCCGNNKGRGPVCTRVICQKGNRPQGGFPNGPRCECCSNSTCSPRLIKKLIRR